MTQTFADLQQRLTNAKRRKAVLLMLVEHIDAHFLPRGGDEAEQKLLDEDNLPVPVELLEAVASDTLTAEVQQLDQEINQILGSNLVVAPPAPPQPPAPPEVLPMEAVQDQEQQEATAEEGELAAVPTPEPITVTQPTPTTPRRRARQENA